MIYRWIERFPRSPVAREFFCFRCQRTMRLYAIFGFSLLLVMVLAIVVTTIWAMREGSLPVGP